MGMLKEFRNFAVRGNVVDMAVGVIIGVAFGKIVSSLVADIIMPPIGKAMGNVNFTDLYFSLDPAKTGNAQSLAQAKEAGAAVIAYGVFINTLIDFIILAFCIFLMVQLINRLKAPPPKPADPTTKDCPRCLMSIPIKATRCGHCTSELASA